MSDESAATIESPNATPDGLAPEEYAQLQAAQPAFAGDWLALKKFIDAFTERRYRVDLLTDWNTWRKEQKAVDLRGVRIHRANLRDADLSGVDLRDAYLPESICQRTNFTGACLSGAILRGCDCDQAQFNEANLQATDLKFCRRLLKQQLSGAHGDASTKLSPPLLPPPTWGITS